MDRGEHEAPGSVCYGPFHPICGGLCAQVKRAAGGLQNPAIGQLPTELLIVYLFQSISIQIS